MLRNKAASIWKNGSLTIVTASLFLLFLVGQSVTGYRNNNQEQQDHGQPTISYVEYLATPEFVEATFENWESEFLQMAMYVLLTPYLFQKGSAESKVPGSKIAETRLNSRSPRILRKSRWIATIYENSLFLALASLFIISLLLHAAGGSGAACNEARLHGSECYSLFGYMTTSQFWFESFQNWQSEFLAVCSLVVLSIFLRQKGSPESKAVGDPNDKTG